ncbi:MAG: hypothetical protein ACRDQA_00380 [Nocardioidaceae bacterium]
MLHGPPIAVECWCGGRRDLAYGERWQCDECGRRWNTEQIPRAQYQQIRWLQMRFRILPVGLGLVVASVALYFALTGNIFSMFLLLPSALMVWMAVLRPLHRRRFRRAIGQLPNWRLTPEPDAE